MKLVLLLSVFLSVSLADDGWGPYGEVCLVGQEWQYNPADSVHVPWYTIDLDKDPTERWREVGETMSDQIRAGLHTVQSVLDFLVPGLYESVAKMCANSINSVPEPYRSEMTGMARTTGISLGEIALLNMFYEVAKGCTSIVAQSPEGKIYHSRNQDFGTGFIWNMTEHTWGQTIALKSMLINVNFVKDGKLLFKGVTFAGHMGILTGLRPHGFTLSTNSRLQSAHQNVVDFFKHGVTGREFILYMDRDVLTKCSTYAEAIDFLSNTPMIAAGYFIVGGRNPGEGAVITRSPNGTDHIATIDTSKKDGWYVLQTNYDWDKPVLYLDDRRGPGHDCMNRLGQANVGHQGLYQVLSSKPNLNKATVYTSVMQVDDLVLESFIRHCDDPCWFV